MRAAVAAVLQRPVLQRASVLDNAAAGLRLRGTPRARARRLARPWLDALGVAHLADRHARTLSGGEAQRVAIARALAVRSRVLLLDEPFAGLDATTRADLIADLRAALDRSTAAVLLVTHDRDEAAALAQRTALLVRGRIRQLGRTAHVLDAPADLECADLLGYTTHLPPPLTGHDVLLVARPERCRLLAPGAARDVPGILVPGTLRRVVPLGGTTRVDVDTAAGPVAVLTTAEVTVASGDPVCVTVDAGDTPGMPVPGLGWVFRRSPVIGGRHDRDRGTAGRRPHDERDDRRAPGHRRGGHHDPRRRQAGRRGHPGALPQRALRPRRRLPDVRGRHRRPGVRRRLRPAVRGRHGGQDRHRGGRAQPGGH